MKLKFKTILIAGLVLGLAFVAWLVWSDQSATNDGFLPAGFDSTLAPLTDSTTATTTTDDYVSTKFGFRFRPPEGLSLTELEDRGGEMILARLPTEEVGPAAGKGAFQIFITPYDEPVTTLTPERIRRDLPDLVMREVGRFSFGATPAELVVGLSFISEGPPFGESREVWFAHRGYLYQLSAYLPDQDLLQTVLQTWRFE